MNALRNSIQALISGSSLSGKKKPSFLVVGLGNPGREYHNHRHNIGFRVVQALANEYGLKLDRFQHQALTTVGKVADRDVLLARPLTYMNRSGESVGPLARANAIAPEHVLVIYDDLDLPLGRLRVRKQGGTGGHGGMQSITKWLETEMFPRLRIGIGRPPAGVDPLHFVVSSFSEDEMPVVLDATERAVAAIECFVGEGIEAMMNRFNRSESSSG